MSNTKWLEENKRDVFFFIGLLTAVGAIYMLGKNRPLSEIATTWGWILLIMVLFTVLASYLITDRLLFGWLINEQNRMSLSRLQMFLWTIVVLSAFVTAVFANLHLEHFETAVSIAIPQELWLAMGISTASLVGTGLIQESKKEREPTEDRIRAVNSRVGLLAKADKASLLDLIRGEEVGNKGTVDLTRVQNLLFTFVLVGAYASSLGAMFAQLATDTVNSPITRFPELGSSAIALLTISHAGYLSAKAIDKQPSTRAGGT